MSTTFVVIMMSTFLLYFVVGSLALEGRDGTGLRASVRKPQLWELIHDHYYEGISRSDVEKISQLTLDSSIKHKDEDSSFIMCASFCNVIPQPWAQNTKFGSFRKHSNQ